jgi:hypothetical protein
MRSSPGLQHPDPGRLCQIQLLDDGDNRKFPSARVAEGWPAILALSEQHISNDLLDIVRTFVDCMTEPQLTHKESMKLSKTILCAAGGFLTVAFAAPRVSATIRAAFVEVVIPSKPFFGALTSNFSQPATGPDTGTLGVTSITVTNFDPAARLISINAPIFSSGSCGTPNSVIAGLGMSRVRELIQPGVS